MKLFKNLDRNVVGFLIINAIHNLWFVEAIWYFYWARFASYTQIGFYFSILTLVWIFAEIPTGLFADKFGRKKATIIANILLLIGAIIDASALNIYWLVVASMIMNIGTAFVSGSLEALVYDSLKVKGTYNHCRKPRTVSARDECNQ
ncbi:MFS transporter [Candidatus Beckwithbacteria bacterium]|nr:MFS transporter [Candidatus Beckwithbacteria bacterium]